MTTQIDDLTALVAIVRGIGKRAAPLIIDQNCDASPPALLPEPPASPMPEPPLVDQAKHIITYAADGAQYLIYRAAYNAYITAPCAMCSPQRPRKPTMIPALTFVEYMTDMIDWEATQEYMKYA